MIWGAVEEIFEDLENRGGSLINLYPVLRKYRKPHHVHHLILAVPGVGHAVPSRRELLREQEIGPLHWISSIVNSRNVYPLCRFWKRSRVEDEETLWYIFVGE